MKLKELYEKGLTRKVNPAVSASDLDDKTVNTEIAEYVFTEEIVINLYKVLNNIRTNQGSHVGVWINGYFGSGKSHFLKYANYCLTRRYCVDAFDRLIEAAKELSKDSSSAEKFESEEVTISNLTVLKKWYAENADIEMVMFNIGDAHNANSNKREVFTTIFWNQFNAMRGYNSFNLAMALYLEKALDDEGKFQEFKDYVKSKNYDWERNITRFAAGKLDLALQMAKDVAPDLSYDVIRTKIQNGDVNVSVEAFAQELREYIDKKNNRNFRLLFFVDEVSQFIGENPDLLLQLQSLVKRLEEVCESKVWIACTAQQKLEEVVANVGKSPEDEVGKILGRFEVKASLQGTDPEYITQKRILEKTGAAEIDLAGMFDREKSKLEAQFVLPSAYRSYRNQEEFVASYPFVPYQFQLIKKVLDSFVDMNWVDKQVKGNERSLINITYSIAQATAENEVGEFIPFDRFFGPMFQGSMQHLGQRALENARHALELITDEKKQDFARRVVYVLFMICNLADNDKPTFLATIDNVVTLLMSKVDENKATIKKEVEDVLLFLMENAVIRKTKTESGVEVYDFYSEEESKVAQIIQNQPVDSLTYSTELYKIINDYIGLHSNANKETYCTRSFNIGWMVDSKAEKSPNPDVVVDFVVTTTPDKDTPELYSFSNHNNHLAYFIAPLFQENKELRIAFLDYCRVQRFALEPVTSEERKRIRQIFLDRSKEIYSKEIRPQMHDILDKCALIAGQNIISPAEIGTTKSQERYKRALNKELSLLYDCATLVNGSGIPKNQSELASSIREATNPLLMDMPLSPAETKVKAYLDRQPHDVTMADIIRDFAKVPYGWSDYATIYITNELVRRHIYAFNYKGNPNVSREEVAAKIVSDKPSFTLEPAESISQSVINAFIDAWKEIFNVVSVKGGSDSTELFRNCKENADSDLNSLLSNYNVLLGKIENKPFAQTIVDAIALMNQWKQIRDPKKFFTTVADAKSEAATLFDKCKDINVFVNGPQWSLYNTILKFLSDQQDNFHYLPADLTPTVEKIKLLRDEASPWAVLPSYKKMMAQLSNQLLTVKQSLIDEIKARYNKVFDDLEKYASEMNVPRSAFALRDITIAQKIGSNNFSTLKLNLDIAAFFAAQMDRINAAIPTPPAPNPQPSSEGDDIPPAPPTPAPRIRKVIKLNIATSSPMRTPADVDLYLAALREEILQQLDDNTDIIIQ